MAETPSQGLRAADITTAGGILIAKITGTSIEAHRGAAVLESVTAAIEQSKQDVHVVVLDLNGISFINSSGITAFVELHNTLKEKQIEGVIYRPTETVTGMFNKLKLATLYRMCYTADELNQILTG